MAQLVALQAGDSPSVHVCLMEMDQAAGLGIGCYCTLAAAENCRPAMQPSS